MKRRGEQGSRDEKRIEDEKQSRKLLILVE